ncbi:putative FAD-linked oxidoreductase YvdP [Staphylotrichum tortipilum]|uniref:FAD-linked oxidoreductase YvdP n=1 Tax=Staphylotrichum tortipilum TaxID=2831512 RepID=A0AAN6MVF0_9PEZI|nr:putative FAD-linked oxidoreductase YvdP [Staphylotrichum longicolle]
MHRFGPLLALLGLAASAHASAVDTAAALTDCLTKAGVPVDASGSADYMLDATPFNLRLNYTPVAVAAVTTVKHIQDAVTCAKQLGVKANAKCGGHSYASFGLGGEDGHLIIEMTRMNKVVLDNATGIATAEGGTRLGHLAYELYNQGKRAISHGTCPGVGVGGHVLHGGYGVSSHTHGLALDWLVGATVVLANSTIVNCSGTENADLFWALRGAGGSMGIVTEFRFKTFEVPEKLTYFVATVQWPTEARALMGMGAVQEFAKTMPAELNMRLFIARRFINLEGLFYGDKEGLQAVLQPLMKQTNATLALAQTGGWLDQVKHFGGSSNIDQGHGHEEHETFYSTSMYTNALTDAQLQTFVSYWFKQAKNNTRDWYVQVDLHGGENSAVSMPDAASTSYAHRDYLLMYLLYDRVDKGIYPADGHVYMDNFVGNVTQGMARPDWGMYINYPDSRLGQEEAQVNYWGGHLAKLQAVKKAVDPGNVFHYPQGILPA